MIPRLGAYSLFRGHKLILQTKTTVAVLQNFVPSRMEKIVAEKSFEPKVDRVLSDLYTGQSENRVEAEVTLPDYKEAAGRIVRVQASSRITEKNASIQNFVAVCEMEGIVSFHVLYLAEGEGESARIASHLVQETFSQSVKIPLGDESITADEVCLQVDLQTENVICKLLGPRKMNLRCEVKMNLNLKGNRDFISYEDFPDEKIFLQKKEWTVSRLQQVCKEKIDLTECISLPSAYPAISEILQMNVDLFCRHVKASEGGIRFSGSSDLRCTYLSQEENRLVSFYQPVEFEKNIGIFHCTENSICRVILTPTFLRANPNVNGEGEMKEICFEIGCSAEIFVFEPVPLSSAEDVYSTKCRLHTEKRGQTCEEILQNMDFSVSQKVTLPKGDSVFVRAEDVSATSRFLHSYVEGQNIVLEGKAFISYLGYDGEGRVHSSQFSHDFKVSVPLESGWDLAETEEARIEVIGICREADLIPRGEEMDLRYEICGTLSLFSHHTSSCLTLVEEKEEYSDSERGLIFYYPEKDEGFWQVCKKFHVAPQCIYGEGDLEEKMPDVVRILLS